MVLKVETKWSKLFISCFLVCFISLPMILAVFFIPESPLFLAQSGQMKRAKEIMSLLDLDPELLDSLDEDFNEAFDRKETKDEAEKPKHEKFTRRISGVFVSIDVLLKTMATPLFWKPLLCGLTLMLLFPLGFKTFSSFRFLPQE